MSSCNLTQTIYDTECLGDSLVKINSNFNSLDTAVCNVSSSYVSKIVAGSNVAIAPTAGTGVVTVSALHSPRAHGMFIFIGNPLIGQTLSAIDAFNIASVTRLNSGGTYGEYEVVFSSPVILPYTVQIFNQYTTGSYTNGIGDWTSVVTQDATTHYPAISASKFQISRVNDGSGTSNMLSLVIH